MTVRLTVLATKVGVAPPVFDVDEPTESQLHESCVDFIGGEG